MVARLALLGALPFSSAAGEGAADGQGRWQFSHTDPSLTYNYLAIGDWGDDSGGQAAAAAGMGAVAEEIHAQEVMHHLHSPAAHLLDGLCLTAAAARFARCTRSATTSTTPRSRTAATPASARTTRTAST